MSAPTKALVLCAGRGTRLKPLTDFLPKSLLPAANRPVVFHTLDKVTDAGITNIGLVVSPETIHPIRTAVGNGSRWGASVHYITQPRPGGLAHAVQVSQDFLGNDPFLMFLGDIVLEQGIEAVVGDYHRQRPAALVALKHVADPRAFGVATLNDDDRIVGLVEKPDNPASSLAVAGIYAFSSRIHEAIGNIAPSPRGELEITDAIQWLVDAEELVQGHRLDGWWSDIATEQDLLTANRRLLESRQVVEIGSPTHGHCRIEGKVDIANGCTIENSVITGPVSIAADCTIKDSSVGPFASVGTGTTMIDAQLLDSIVFPHLRVEGGRLLNGLVIGSDLVVTGDTPSAA